MTTASPLSRSVLAGCLLALSLMSGCATVDQNIALTYTHVDRSFGSHSGNIVVTRAESLAQKRNDRGEWLLGSLNTAQGVHQANILTNRIPGEWITEALLLELKKSGFNAAYRSALPDRVPVGVAITDIKAFLNVNKGAVSDDTRHEIQFNAHVFIDGSRVKIFTVASRDNRTFGLSVSREDMERIMLQSLQEAMQQIVPDIISLIEKK